MEKPICLITGATEGVGKFTALELAGKGFTVVMAARNRHKAELVKAEAAARSKGHVDYIVADLGSINEVHQLAETFKRRIRKTRCADQQRWNLRRPSALLPT